MNRSPPPSLRALAHRNFRLFLAGQGTAQLGNGVQLIATGWLTYQLSGSVAYLRHMPGIRREIRPVYERLGIPPLR